MNILPDYLYFLKETKIGIVKHYKFGISKDYKQRLKQINASLKKYNGKQRKRKNKIKPMKVVLAVRIPFAAFFESILLTLFKLWSKRLVGVSGGSEIFRFNFLIAVFAALTYLVVVVGVLGSIFCGGAYLIYLHY